MKLILSFLAGGLLLVPLTGAQAATLTFAVTNNNDSGPGSLRAAVIANNARTDGDRNLIIFKGEASDIALQSELPIIKHRAEFQGRNKDTGVNITVRRLTSAPKFRLFSFAATVDANLTQFNLVGGSVEDKGGLIYNAGIIDLRECTLTGGSAPQGGAIFNEAPATLFIVDSTLAGNSGTTGGGIYNQGYTEVYGSLIANNIAQQGGGAAGVFL
ncbi:hypothetical protein EON80_24175, partial [bacterium]